MTKSELTRAYEIAQSDADLSDEDISHMSGYGFASFKPVHVTLRQVAKMIRWQCFYLNGGIDGEEMAMMAETGRRKFIVIGGE